MICANFRVSEHENLVLFLSGIVFIFKYISRCILLEFKKPSLDLICLSWKCTAFMRQPTSQAS